MLILHLHYGCCPLVLCRSLAAWEFAGPSCPPSAIATDHRHFDQKKCSRKTSFLVSDRHSIAIADFGVFRSLTDTLRGSTQTLTMIGTLGCANLCSTKTPPLTKDTRLRDQSLAITISTATSIARSSSPSAVENRSLYRIFGLRFF